MRERLALSDPTEVRLLAVTKAELLYGARHSARPAENLRLLERFWAPLLSLPFDDRCAEHYGMIREGLAARGHLIGPNDLMIADIARTHGLTLVTHDVEEFSRVPDLKIEDWEAA